MGYRRFPPQEDQIIGHIETADDKGNYTSSASLYRYYYIGDGDTAILFENKGTASSSADLTVLNMTLANYTSDVPG